MNKTTIAITTMSLILTLVVTASGQDRRRRAPQQVGNPIGLGGTVTAGVKQTPNQVQSAKRKSPTSTGDQPEMQITNSRQQNLGDTGTHEVGHKGKRRSGQFRPNPTGDGTTQQFRKTNTNGQNNRTRASQPKQMKLGDIKGEVIKSQQPNAAKYDGIDGESNDARTKSPNSGASPAGIAMATEVAAKDIRKQSNKRRKTQNLLPYMEQGNLKARPRSK